MDQDKIDAFNEQRAKEAEKRANEETAQSNAKSVADTVKTGSLLNAKASKEVRQAVQTTGDKVASEVEKVQSALQSGQDSVAQAINNLMLATVLTKDPKLAEAADNVAKLLSSIADAGDKFGKSNLNLLPVANKELAKTISDLAKSVREKQEEDLTPQFDRVVEALNSLDVQPVVNVPKSDVSVDTQPITDAIKELQKSIKPQKIDIPKVDFKDVIKGLGEVQKTISSLSFPVPNYVLPFKDVNGRAVQVQLDSSGNIPTSSSGGGGGAVTVADGADVAEGAVADAAVAAGAAGTVSAKLRRLTTDLDAVKTSVAGATPAGTNLMGKVGIDQTTPGTTNGVQVNAALPAGANAIGKLAANSGVDIGDVDVTSVPTDPFGANADAASATGSISAKLRFIAGTGIPITGTVTVGSHAVTNAGTFATQASEADGANVTLGAKADAKSTATDTTAITAMQVLKQISASVQAPPSQAVTNAGTFAVQAVDAGDVAHDGVDSGNPVKVGGKATNVEPAAVSASGDRANFITDMVGKLITLPYSNPENFVSGAITSAMTGTTSTSLVGAPAGSLRNYITTIIVSNAHATVGTDVVIQDGSGGTTLLTIPAAAVYGGAVITLPTPLRQPTTATAIYCANVTTGASTKVSAVGYKGV